MENNEAKEKFLILDECAVLVEVLKERVLQACKQATGKAFVLQGVHKELTAYVPAGLELYFQLHAENSEELENELQETIVQVRRKIGLRVFCLKMCANDWLAFDGLFYVPGPLAGESVQIPTQENAEYVMLVGKKAPAPILSDAPKKYTPSSDPAFVSSPTDPQLPQMVVPNTAGTSSSVKNQRAVSSSQSLRSPLDVPSQNTLLSSLPPPANLLDGVPDRLIDFTRFKVEKFSHAEFRLRQNLHVNNILRTHTLLQLMKTRTPRIRDLENFFKKINSPTAKQHDVWLDKQLQTALILYMVEIELITLQ